MTRPKVAVCFSGQPRSWRSGSIWYIKNLIDRKMGIDVVDVFIHSWWDNKTDFKDIMNVYTPKKMLIERPLKDEVAQRYTNIASPKHPAIATYSSFYSINQSFKLIPKGEYDWVIRTRFDYALNGVINFEGLDTGIVYVPNCRMTPERNFCNDQFAYGSYETMAKYCATFDNLDFYYNRDTKMNGEDMLAENLNYYKLIGPNMVYVDMKNPFPPGPNNSTWHSLIRDDINEWQK